MATSHTQQLTTALQLNICRHCDVVQWCILGPQQWWMKLGLFTYATPLLQTLLWSFCLRFGLAFYQLPSGHRGLWRKGWLPDISIAVDILRLLSHSHSIHWSPTIVVAEFALLCLTRDECIFISWNRERSSRALCEGVVLPFKDDI